MRSGNPFEMLMQSRRGEPPTPRAAEVEAMELRAALEAWHTIHRFEAGQIVRYKQSLTPSNLLHVVPTGLFIVMETYDDEEAAERLRWDDRAGMRRDLRVGCFDGDGEFQMSYTDSRLYELAPGEVLT